MHTRRNFRKHLVLYLDVLTLPNYELLGHLGDISESGLMFITQHGFTIGEELDLAIRLPNNSDFGQPTIDARVVVRWMQPNLNPRLTCIGCQFIRLNSDDLSLIQKIGDFIGFDASIDVHRVAEPTTTE